jgi:hypothetical protein
MDQDRLQYSRRECPRPRLQQQTNVVLRIDDEQLACPRPNGPRSHSASRSRGPHPRPKRTHPSLPPSSPSAPTNIDLPVNSSGPYGSPRSPAYASSTKSPPKWGTCSAHSRPSCRPQRARTSSSMSSPSSSTSFTPASNTGPPTPTVTPTRSAYSSDAAAAAHVQPDSTPTARCGSNVVRE